ncbi:hypothetical protein F2Q70_00016868 [Brassica cretica]|uniref:PB1 domain-containing protein n=2 Tax=Brassica TaxID=3705 RepID=A0A8S9HYX9_BRACR|nr:PREDICTED: uncharacterized protein LOC106327534 [Brassica oleracea var. oleracea]KAF2563525.1 hypothetical protein F2Q70_00016868 [Brassica cretica]KAF2596231.1 hypothetical protein F2Q68_00009837 [Brassica cretica]KAF3541376.1 hypothetical protein F2Q69_00021657 [Brassica cretica]
MASTLQPEMDNDSMASSPRSEYDNQPRVRFMCTFGGRILPRPPDNQLSYVGGDNRMIAVHRNTSFASLLNKLAKLSGKSNISVKYQLPNEDLDALISVSTDEDVENMMDEYDRVAQNQNPRSSRLRLFLFTNNIAGEDDNDSRASSISSLLDSSVNREQWFLDALNLGSSAVSNGGSGKGFERVRSEVSSIVSEVPDYLFGLDTFDETAPPHELRDRDPRAKIRREVSTLSDPGSPRRDVPSPYGSTSSAPVMRSSTPELQPVQTKPDSPEPVSTPKSDPQPEQVIQQSNLPVNPQWQYSPGPQVHYQQPVYYVPSSVQPGNHMVQPGNHMIQQVNHMVQQGNHMVQPVQMPGQYVPQYHHLPMGYHHQPQTHRIPGPGLGQVYGGTARPVMMAVDGVNRPAYYDMKTPGPVQMYHNHPGMVVPGMEGQYRTETDSDPGRAS